MNFRLKRFEFSQLSCIEHQKEFEKLFNQGVFDIDDVLYQCWLLLKIDANGSEEEVFQHILKSRTPTNLQKKVRKRKKVEPDGANKYDPLSSAWTQIYLERGLGEETDNSNNKYRKRTTSKRGCRGGGAATVISRPSSSSSTVPSTSGLFPETSTPAVPPAGSEFIHPSLSGPATTLMLTQSNVAADIVELSNMGNVIGDKEVCLVEPERHGGGQGQSEGGCGGRDGLEGQGGRIGPGGHGGPGGDDDKDRRGGGRGRGRGRPGGRGGSGSRGGKHEFDRKSRTGIKHEEKIKGSEKGNWGNFENDVKVEQPTEENLKVQPTRIQPKRIKGNNLKMK